MIYKKLYNTCNFFLPSGISYFSKIMARVITSIFLLLLVIVFILNMVKESRSSIDAKQGCQVDCVCGTPPSERIESFLVQNLIGTHLNSSTAECSTISEQKEFCASISCFHTTSKLMKDRNIIRREVIHRSNVGSKSSVLKLPKECNDTLKPVENGKTVCKASRDLKGIICKIQCAFGFVLLEDGKALKKTRRTCHINSSSWSPKGTFPACIPYINCKVVLVKRGHLDCKRSLDFPTYCDISCDADGEHGAVPKMSYKCVDDRFSVSLPHCAALDKDVVLVKLPKYSSKNNI